MIKLTEKAYQVIAAVVVTLIATVVIVIGGQTVLSWRDRAERGDAVIAEQQRTSEAASAITTAAMQEQQEAAHVEVVVKDARSTYQEEKKELQNAKPEVRDYSNQPVPSELRDLAKKRRLSRERSARVAVQREERDEAEDSAER